MKFMDRVRNLSPVAKVIIILFIVLVLCSIFHCSYCPSYMSGLFAENFAGEVAYKKTAEGFSSCGAPRRTVEGFYADTEVAKPDLVLFYVDWCPHCKEVKPMFEQLKAKYPERVKMMNAEDPANVEMAKKYKVEAYPTIMMIGSNIENGALEYSGDRSMESIEAFLQKYI